MEISKLHRQLILILYLTNLRQTSLYRYVGAEQQTANYGGLPLQLHRHLSLELGVKPVSDFTAAMGHCKPDHTVIHEKDHECQKECGL